MASARRLLTFLPAAEPARADRARLLARGLAARVDRGPARALLVSTVDGEPASRSPLARAFVDAGFTASASGLHRRARPTAAAAPVVADADDATPASEA